MFGGDETWKDNDAASLNGEIVETAAEGLPTVFRDPEAAALSAIARRHLLKMDDSMNDAMHSFIKHVGRQIIEQKDCRPLPGKVMFERKDLAAVAQRALS